MNQDSRAAADRIGNHGTLLVWGYRPDIYAYTRMKAGTRYLDSQPLTGVLADRHLTNSEVIAPELAAGNRHELSTTSPDWIVDGLALYNPSLAISNYPDLRAWLAKYHEVARTRGTIIYRRVGQAVLPAAGFRAGLPRLGTITDRGQNFLPHITSPTNKPLVFPRKPKSPPAHPPPTHS